MKLGTTYISVGNMEESLEFYKKLLQKEPSYSNDDRWITFNCGNVFSLYNKEYDMNIIKNSSKDCFNDVYIREIMKEDIPKNNMIILNFEVGDLRKEYKRIKELEIGKISEIMYVNIHMPYWYFNLEDPDGNILEISGKYDI